MTTKAKRTKEPVWIAPALHRRLKRLAQAEGRSMKWLAERAIEALLACGSADGRGGTPSAPAGRRALRRPRAEAADPRGGPDRTKRHHPSS